MRMRMKPPLLSDITPFQGSGGTTRRGRALRQLLRPSRNASGSRAKADHGVGEAQGPRKPEGTGATWEIEPLQLFTGDIQVI